MHPTEIGELCPKKTVRPISHKGGVDMGKRKFDNNSSEGFGKGIWECEYEESTLGSLLHWKPVRLSNPSVDEKSKSQSKDEGALLVFCGYFRSKAKTVNNSDAINHNTMRTQTNILPLIMISEPSNEPPFRLFPLHGSRKTTSQNLEHETVLKTLINHEPNKKKKRVIRFITNNRKISTQMITNVGKINVKANLKLSNNNPMKMKYSNAERKLELIRRM
jgi:hypothetical protein